MRCEDARRYLSPYLDSELDPKISFDIADHLEQCEACRRRFESERAIESGMAAQLKRAGPGDDEAWAAAMKKSGGARRSLWPRVAAASAAAALLVVAIFLLASERHDLLDELAQDHEKLAAGHAHFDLESSDPRAIEKFFDTRMGIAIHVQPVKGMEPVGARQCSLRGTPTAFIAYRCGSQSVSIAVFDATHLDRFPRDRGFVGGGIEYSRGALRIVARQHGWKVVCATGSVSLGELRAACAAFSE